MLSFTRLSREAVHIKKNAVESNDKEALSCVHDPANIGRGKKSCSDEGAKCWFRKLFKNLE